MDPNDTYLFIDLETDGIYETNFKDQQVIQISYKIYQNRQNVIDVTHIVKQPAVMPFAEMSNRPTLEEIKNGNDWEDVLKELVHFINMYEVKHMVAHNIDFDAYIIDRDIEKFKLTIPELQHHCTMKLSTVYCGLQNRYCYKYPKLNELATKLLIEFDKHKMHEASYDVHVLVLCFFKMIELDII